VGSNPVRSKNKGIDFEDKRRNGQVVSEDCPITRKSARRSGQHETTTGQYEMWNGKEMGTIGRNETTVRELVFFLLLHYTCNIKEKEQSGLESG
jgi:hypothetical protein